MIKQNVIQRLKRLEDRILPSGLLHIIKVIYVNSDGTQAPGGYTVTGPSCGGADDRRRGGRRASRRL